MAHVGRILPATPRGVAAVDGAQVRRLLLFAIGLALLVRLQIATNTAANLFDMGSFQIVGDALASDPLGVYAIANPPGVHHWPYLPGYFPWIAVAHALDGAGIVSLRLGAPLPAMLADIGLAWLVWIGLGRTALSTEKRLAAAMVVLFGPTFIVTSALHGQIDAVAIAPAVAALLVWERGGPRRALAAGALIGLAACVKTAPGLMVFALLPTVRSRREAAILLGAAMALPLATLLPFLLADPHGVLRGLAYSGVPGMGGLSLLAQPELGKTYVLAEQYDVRAGPLVLLMDRAGMLITAPALLAAAFVAYRRRLEPREAAVLLWLTFLVFQTAFAFQYAVWVLPFLLLAGHLRGAVALQLVLLVPAILYYGGPWPADRGDLWVLFVVLMVGAWAGSAEALRRAVARLRTA